MRKAALVNFFPPLKIHMPPGGRHSCPKQPCAAALPAPLPCFPCWSSSRSWPMTSGQAMTRGQAVTSGQAPDVQMKRCGSPCPGSSPTALLCHPARQHSTTAHLWAAALSPPLPTPPPPTAAAANISIPLCGQSCSMRVSGLPTKRLLPPTTRPPTAHLLLSSAACWRCCPALQLLLRGCGAVLTGRIASLL